MSKRQSKASMNGHQTQGDTQRKLVRLRELGAKAGPSIYERCKLASEILADDGWIVSQHGGDLDAAEKAIEDEHFADLSGFIVLNLLVAIYRKFPAESDWKELRYSLAAMRSRYREATKEVSDEKPKQKRATLAELEQLQEELAAAHKRSESMGQTVTSQAEEITELKDRVRQLEAECEELRRMMATRERRGNRQPAGAV